MSQMIRCDKCKDLMYADDRSDKNAYCALSIDYIDGHSIMHLCKNCHRQLIVEFLRNMTLEEYDEYYDG